MNELVKYLAYTAKLEKKKEELAKIGSELKDVNAAIEILGETAATSALYKHWDVLNKKEKMIKYVIAKLELEIAKFELDQAYAE